MDIIKNDNYIDIPGLTDQVKDQYKCDNCENDTYKSYIYDDIDTDDFISIPNLTNYIIDKSDEYIVIPNLTAVHANGIIDTQLLSQVSYVISPSSNGICKPVCQENCNAGLCPDYCETHCEKCEGSCMTTCEKSCQCTAQGCQACQECQCSAEGCMDTCQKTCQGTTACQVTCQNCMTCQGCLGDVCETACQCKDEGCMECEGDVCLSACQCEDEGCENCECSDQGCQCTDEVCNGCQDTCESSCQCSYEGCENCECYWEGCETCQCGGEGGQTEYYGLTLVVNPANSGSTTGGGTYEEGSTATITATAASGYKFINWTYTTGTEFSKNSTDYVIMNQNKSFIANFGKLYTVTFDGNGGSVTKETQEGLIGDSITVTAGWAHHTFLGWYTEKTGGTKITTIRKTETLYAHWSETQYTVTYDGNGGTPSAETQTGPYGTDLTGTATRTGYTFNGWWSAAEGGSKKLQITCDETVYAHWTINSYKLTCYYRCGSEEIAESTEEQVEYNKLVSIEGHKKTIDFYTFKSVAPPNDFNMPAYDTEIIYIYTYSPNVFILKYDTNGGIGTFPDQTDTQPKKEQTFTIHSHSPKKEGYDFNGWTDGIDVYQPSGLYTMKPGTKTLVAQWTIKQYSISYNNNGGTGTITTQIKNHGTSITLSDGSSFSKTNCRLDKWNTKDDGTGTSYALGGTYSENADATMYAQWIQLYRLTIKVIPDGSGTVTGAGMYESGVIVNVSAQESEGYHFVAWKKDGQTISDERTYSFTMPASSVALQAEFALDECIYTLTYSKNTTDIVYNMPSNQKYPDSGTTTDKTHRFYLEGSPSRIGYSFGGWSGSSTGTTPITYIDATQKDHDKTVNAIWIKVDPYRVLATDTPSTGKIEGIASITPSGIQEVEVGASIEFLMVADTSKSWPGSTWTIEDNSKKADICTYGIDRWYIDYGSGNFNDTEYASRVKFTPTSSPTTIYPNTKSIVTGHYFYKWLFVYIKNAGETPPIYLTAETGYDSNGNRTSKKPATIIEMPTEWDRIEEGYAFDGWYTAQTGGTKYIIGTEYQIAYNTAIYAQWKKKKSRISIRVTPDSTYGTATGAGMYDIGTDQTLVAKPAKKKRFDGWYIDNVLQSNEATYKIKITDKDITYEARFADRDKDFHWTGTFGETEIDTDVSKIKKGEPVTNITANVWNNQLIPRIRNLEEIQKKPASYIPEVQPGDTFTHEDFNYVRNAIYVLTGGSSITDTVNKGDTVYATLFANESRSIKEVLNYIINL